MSEAETQTQQRQGGSYLHFGEKAKEKTFWSSTRARIDSWEIEGKMLIVKGHEEAHYFWNFGRTRIHILGMEGPWKAFFPASVCAVWAEDTDYQLEEYKLWVEWPMWLKDIRCYADRPERPEAATVADILRMRECKVPELTLKILSAREPRSTSVGSVMECTATDGTGNIVLTVWGSEDIERILALPEDGQVTIKDGYAKEYKGVVSVSAGKFGQLAVKAVIV